MSEMENFQERSQILSQSEEEFLQPISKFYPANQLISKDYSPDQKPILKLIKPQKIENLTCQILRNNYATLFDEDDTLGYHYSYSLSHNIVYLKMNNQNYMKYKTKSGTYRFLAGFFISPERLLSQQLKTNAKNIYKNLNDIQYTEYKSNIQESFGSNCKANPLDLRFSSNFQSGNLFIAMKKRKFQYELILQNDINSKGNIQWFNFVTEFRSPGVYKFNILNFTKSYSQYQNGMKILTYHFNDSQYGHPCWARVGDKIKYQQSVIRRQDCEYKSYYSLKFQYTCSQPGKVQFSYFYPYTNLDLQKFLKKTLYRKLNVHMKMEKIKVCQTISGLPIYVIHIHHKRLYKQQAVTNIASSPSTRNFGQMSTFSSNNIAKQNMNKSVVFMGRQHAGETQGSFIIQGIIDLLMENGQIDYLKKNFDFYIFPMVNADGVFYGNYRTNLSGTDLNRIWRNPRKDTNPEVFHIKKYLMSINSQAPISLILDIHGHSKSLNSFFYGNPPKKDVMTGQSEDTRLFPFVCSKKIKQVSYSQSTFNVSEDKKNSARVVLSEYFPRALIYTLQNSFQGWRKESGNIHEYTPDVLRKIGRQLSITYLQFQKLIEKNSTIKEKWAKQIQQLKSKQSQKNTKKDSGESDSQAELELINICQDFPEVKDQEQSLFTKNCTSFTSILRNKINYSQRQKIFKRNIHMNSNVQKKYTKYNRSIPSLQSSNKISHKKQNEQKMINTSGQGFLSIVKIKTNGMIQNINPCPPKSRQKQNYFKQKQRIGNKQNIGSEKGLSYMFIKDSAQRLKKQDMKIQDAVTSSSGMKAFLQAMGIPLDRKYF